MDVFDTLVAQFGAAAKDSLNGPGEPEAALATPVDNLLREYGEKILSRKVVLHAEVREDSGNVRPDFGVRIDGLMSGHVELKKPGTSLDPSTYGKTTHNGKQWKRLRNLPNLLHTNGLEWRLWRYGELVAIARLPVPSLTKYKGTVSAPPELDTVLSSFLSWTPTPITTVTRLVDTIAPLAALLREEVLESLKANRRNAKATGREENSYPFIGLKRDWRASLYPNATDEEFADGFAQTVVFALVIALSDGMDFNNIQLRGIAEGLQSKHSLLGRSLDLLTEHIKGSTVGLVLETIIRTLSATDWRAISGGNQDVYLHLYEHFLNTYDPALRKKSGSYYTPTEVVAAMIRLTDQALQKYLSIPEGLSADSVAVIDPAMGTGTYNPIEHVSSRVKTSESILDKAKRKGCEPSLDSIREQLTDIAGIRITCSFIADTYAVLDALTSQDDIRVLEVKDYIANPKPNGYKSLHAIIEIPVFLSTGAVPVAVEVQIRTIAMDFWASLEHKIFYKYQGTVPDNLVADLAAAADAADSLDRRMEQLHAEVHGTDDDIEEAESHPDINDAIMRRLWEFTRGEE